MAQVRSDKVLLAGVLVVTALALAPKLTNGFVFDDLFVFVASDRIHDIANVPAFFSNNTMYVTGRTDPLAVDTYRPLTLTTFAIDSLFTGKSPIGYHLTNLLIHLLCVVLVYRVGRAAVAEPNRPYVWIAAAWFAVSPWLGEAHIWINGRSDPLCALFALASIAVWDRALREKRWPLHLAAGGLLFASLLCKEASFGLIPCLWFWPRLERDGARWKARLLALAAPVGAAGLYLGIRFLVLDGLGANAGTSHLVESVSNFGLLFFDSLRAVLLPMPPYLRSLAESYAVFSAGARWSLTIVAFGLVGASLLWRHKQPTWTWAVLFFAGALAPVVTVTALIWPGFGRYLYLPFAGLCIGLVDFGVTMLRRSGALERVRTRRLLGGVVAVLFLANAVLLSDFARDFESDGTLYAEAIERAPHHAYGYAYVGSALVIIGKAEEALPYLEKAVSLQPYEPQYRTKYAHALIQTGQEAEAARLAESWVRTGRRQDMPLYLMTLMDAHASHDRQRALAAGQACVRDFPEYAGCHERLRQLTHD